MAPSKPEKAQLSASPGASSGEAAETEGKGLVRAFERLIARAWSRVVEQAAVELSTNLRATASLERLWLIARFAIAATVLGGAYSAWGTDGPGEFVYVASGMALAGNIYLFILLRRGRSTAVFISGFLMDNVAIFAAWTGSVWLLRGSLSSNDLYLALFPILTLWSARLGFVIGIPYITLWLIWIGWSLQHFFHPLSYEVEQLPLRIIFIGLAALIGMWITHALRKQTIESERRGERARSLQEIARARNEFISSVSHELRTPLTVILGFTEVLNSSLAGIVTDRQKAQINAITRNGNHLNRLISDLLDLTRLEAGKMTLTKDDFPLDGLLAEVAGSFEFILADKQQSLVIDRETEPIWVHADRGRVLQVLMNLVSNASKYSPKGTRITLRSVLSGDTVSVTVEDEGQGISVEDQQDLFTMFYRTGDAAASTTPGNGIGLYLCKRIVEFHNGGITVDSEPGRGTAMTFTLPDAWVEEQGLKKAS